MLSARWRKGRKTSRRASFGLPTASWKPRSGLLYAEQAAQHELSPSGFFLSLKARASILFARLLPNRFIGMLTQATQDYVAELQTVVRAAIVAGVM